MMNAGIGCVRRSCGSPFQSRSHTKFNPREVGGGRAPAPRKATCDDTANCRIHEGLEVNWPFSKAFHVEDVVVFIAVGWSPVGRW